MIAKTVAEQLDMILNPKPQADEKSLVVGILRELPHDISPPTISNVKAEPNKERYGNQQHGWCSFRKSYGEEHNPIAIAQTLESVGWELLPASLARYGNYRRSPHQGLFDQLPNEYSQAKLNDSEQILPVWVKPAQHGEPSVEYYAKTPQGRIIHVLLDIPGAGVMIHAKRVETRGNWHYEGGTAKLHFPQHWHNLPAPIGCNLNNHSRGYVDTEQGISGAIYWHEPENAVTASQVITQLLTGVPNGPAK